MIRMQMEMQQNKRCYSVCKTIEAYLTSFNKIMIDKVNNTAQQWSFFTFQCFNMLLQNYYSTADIIMIISSDKQFNNTYQLLRVLANQDYLAAGTNHSYFILSPSKQLHLQLNATHHRLIDSVQTIDIQSIQYLVFPITAQQLVWAGSNDKHIIRQHIIIFFRQAVSYILHPLLWHVNAKQARACLCISNFWLLDGQLYLILAKRKQINMHSIRRCQQNLCRLAQASPIKKLIQKEEKIMKDFAIILWQIIQLKMYNQEDYGSYAMSISPLLKAMIQQRIGYQQLSKQLQKLDQTELKFSRHFQAKHMRCQTLQNFEGNRRVLKTRKSCSFGVRPINRILSHTKSRSISKESINHPNTLEVFANTNIKAKQKKYTFLQPYDSHILSGWKRSHSEVDIDNRSQLTQHNRTQSRFQTLSTSKRLISGGNSQTKYGRWLSNKKYSVNIQQMIHKQGSMAKQKFEETIQHFETPNTQKIESEKVQALKLRLLTKAIKFKTQPTSVITDDVKKYYSQVQDIPKQHNRTLDELLNIQNQSRTQNDQKAVIPFITVNNNNYVSKGHGKLTLNKVSQITIDNHQQQAISQPILNAQKIKSAKIQNQYIKTQQFAGRQVNLIHDKQQVKYVKASKQFRLSKKQKLLAEEDNQFQEIKLTRQVRQANNPSKESIKETKDISKNNQQIYKKQPEQIQLLNVNEYVNQYLSLINILGDITVKSINLKDKLANFQWRQGIYFIYERFYYERVNFVTNLNSNNKKIVRVSRTIDNDQWKKWVNSHHKIKLSQKINSQNSAIHKTLNRFASKLLQLNNISKKIQLFIRNRQTYHFNCDYNTRLQLSRQAIDGIIGEFDVVVERKINDKQIINHVLDGLFGLKIISQLDGLLPLQQQVKIQQYRQYSYNLRNISKQADQIYSLYFKEETNL